MEYGSGLTTRQIGPWSIWTRSGHVDADPYTRAYLARSGRLPITSASARYYRATRDSDGDLLDAECKYVISGTGPKSAWWSLAAYDGDGALMKNPAGRYAVDSKTIMRDGTGEFSVSLSSDARPGNWLPVNSDYRVMLVLRVYRPVVASDQITPEIESGELPEIKNRGCR